METLTTWITTQKSLLQLEKEEEELQLAAKLTSLSAKECEEQGISLLHLEIVATATSLFGRSTVTVKPAQSQQQIQQQQQLQQQQKAQQKAGQPSGTPTHKSVKISMKVGDEVRLYNPKLASAGKQKSSSKGKDNNDDDDDEGSVTGVISKIVNAEISIVCDDELPDESSMSGSSLRLDLRSNDYTFRKMMTSLSDLGDRMGHPLVRVLFDPTCEPRPLYNNIQITGDKLFNKGLNESQISAVNCALNAPSVALIHGPVSWFDWLILDCSDVRCILCCSPELERPPH
jgi:hypothetical protein